MKNIEIIVKENENINYTYILEIESLIPYIKDITIINNQIIFSTHNTKVTINNYKNSNDVLLNSIMNKLFIIKKNKRKEQLKKRKIKRKKTFAYTLIISLILIKSNIFPFVLNAQNYKDVYNETNLEMTERFEPTSITDNIEIITENIEEDYKNKKVIDIAFESRVETDKFRVTKAYYNDIITKISNEYGIDPQIMLAIATQESGIHTVTMNNPAIGLMQIERSVWNNKNISAYNYTSKTIETLNITEEKLKDLEFNIKVSCMYFQNCLKNSNYNLAVAIQMYNFGYGNIENIFKMYYNANIQLDYALNNYDDGWLECRNNISVGDSMYLEHILSYIEDLDNLKCKKDNETIFYSINQTTNNKIL